MSLEDVLFQHHWTILDRWFNLIVGSYSSDAGKFIRKSKDRFANPVGGDAREGLEGILESLRRWAASGDWDREAIDRHLNRIIRIRAVQNFKPSAALAFIPEMKTGLGDILSRQKESLSADELTALEDKMDDMLFQAFDVYAACREDLFQIRIRDEQRRISCSCAERISSSRSRTKIRRFPDRAKAVMKTIMRRGNGLWV